jgi:Telomere resolvase
MSATPLSYSHDLTRDEIIARYRSRISQGKRSKLGKSELEQLILHLIDRLKTAQTSSEVKALCDAEIALLEEGYTQSSVAFEYLPRYRKAVGKAIANGMIPLNPQISHTYLHTQRVTGIEEQRFEHYALSYLKYDVSTYESLDSRSSETNRHKQLNLKGVNPHLYLDKLNELLYSNDKFSARHQAIAIAGLTGRRLNEVLARLSQPLKRSVHVTECISKIG